MKKLPPMRAIAANCKDCIYDPQEPGTHTQQIENCSITKCNLYNHRPITSKTRARNREIHLSTLTDAERSIVLEASEKLKLKMATLRNSSIVADHQVL